MQSSPLISRTQIKRLSMLEAPGLMGVSICGIFYISIERIIIIFDIQYHNSTSFLNLVLLFFIKQALTLYTYNISHRSRIL